MRMKKLKSKGKHDISMLMVSDLSLALLVRQKI